jgi:hypothetical protein
MSWLKELKGILKPGQAYYVMFRFKGLVVKRKMKLLEYDFKEKFLVFASPNGNVSKLIPAGENLYVFVDRWNMYIKASIFSERKGKLFLYIEDLVPPPPFINRQYVRVEPDPGSPVKVEIIAGDRSFKGEVKDISEAGIGIILDRKNISDEELIELKKIKRLEANISLPIGNIKAILELRHILELDRYRVLLGFSMKVSKLDERTLQKYIFERQREIAKEISSL